MRRNRKCDRRRLRTPGVIRTASLLLTIGLIGVAFGLIRNQHIQKGDEIRLHRAGFQDSVLTVDKEPPGVVRIRGHTPSGCCDSVCWNQLHFPPGGLNLSMRASSTRTVARPSWRVGRAARRRAFLRLREAGAPQAGQSCTSSRRATWTASKKAFW